MSRVLIYSVLCFSLGAGVTACSRDRDPAAKDAYQSNAARALPDKDHVEVTGCVTANQETNQFVLTANSNALTALTNRAGAGEAETFHYQLVGGTDLQKYVGKEVIVKGSVEGKGDDINIESKKEKVELPPTKSRGEEVTPAIESQQEIEMQVERLQVASVTPTGAPCQRTAG